MNATHSVSQTTAATCVSSHQKSSHSPVSALISTQSSPPSRVAMLLGSPGAHRVKSGVCKLLTSRKVPSCTKSCRPNQALPSAVDRQGAVRSLADPARRCPALWTDRGQTEVLQTQPGVAQRCGQTGGSQKSCRPNQELPSAVDGQRTVRSRAGPTRRCPALWMDREQSVIMQTHPRVIQHFG